MTTAPPATKAPSPIVNPGIIVAFEPIETSFSIVMGSQLYSVLKGSLSFVGGWISIEMEEYSEAGNFFDMALGIDALCSEALYGKGLVMKRRGEDYSTHQLILSQIDKELVI